MKSHALSLLVGLVASLPTSAFAEEVFADLGGARVPVGPEGTSVVRVERTTVSGVRYAIVRSRDAALPSRCAVPAERVSVWTQSEGRWSEAASEVFDRCPADRRARIALAVRARVVQWGEGPAEATELHVRLLDPRLPAASAPTMRYRLVGDRFTQGRGDQVLAAGQGLPALPLAAARGRIETGVLPFAHLRGVGPQQAAVWLGAEGSVLRFAARIEGPEAARAEFSLRLAEPGLSSARIRGNVGNAGRVITVRCDEASLAGVVDARVRCTREGDAVRLEGETDLATMLWSHDAVEAVTALAAVTFSEGRMAASDPALRLRTLALPAPFSVMEGASAEALATCAGRYRGRVSEAAGIGAMEGVITCGNRCENGLCERVVGTRGAATRMVWEASSRGNGTRCLNVTGAGSQDFSACRGERGDFTRLVGRIPARGFDLVIALERSLRGPAGETRRPEVWALVTRSARWHRLWQGSEVDAATPRITSVSLADRHPTLCRGANDGAHCERIDALSFMSSDERAAAAWVSSTSARWN